MIDPFRFGPWVSAEARALFRAESTRPRAPSGDLAAIRAHYDAWNRQHLATARETYDVAVASEEIDGVRVDVVTPRRGGQDEGRTLLCLHGGAFMWGRGAGALVEAVPIAATARIRTIAVEYALAPEHVFPRAVEDVLAVYRALLDRQEPSSIGLFGCSAGAILTAQAIARMAADGLPRPGAAAMLCGGGLDMVGDAVATAVCYEPTNGTWDPPKIADLPYFDAADPRDPLVFPGEHPDVLACFPPTLLVTGSRDFAASSVTTMHRRLRAARVDASLLHFDGMWHAFHMATTLPEARETFAAMTSFFEAHLR